MRAACIVILIGTSTAGAADPGIASSNKVFAENLAACSGYYHAVSEAIGQHSISQASKTAESTREMAAKAAKAAQWDGYLTSIAEAKQVFDQQRASDPGSFLQRTDRIARDCKRVLSVGTSTSQADVSPDIGDFEIRGTVMRVGDIALGDKVDVCEGSMIEGIGDGQLAGCLIGSEKDRLSIVFDSSKSYVVKVERKLFVDYRRMDWRKFVESARAYGQPDAYNLDHWLVAYGDNFAVTGTERDPVVEWKSAGRGLVMQGKPCSDTGCDGVAGTNVEVTITLQDSNELQLAIEGLKSEPKGKPALAADGHNLAFNEVRSVIKAAEEAKQRLRQAKIARAEAAAEAARQASIEQERKLASASWRTATEGPDDGSLAFKIHGKLAKVQGIALGDGPEACPTKIKRLQTGDAEKRIFNYCVVGDNPDQTAVYYNADKTQVVRVIRRIGVDHTRFDLKAFLDAAEKNYGDGAFRNDNSYSLGYGTSFDVRENTIHELETGRGLTITADFCHRLRRECVRTDDRTMEIWVDLKDIPAYEQLLADSKAEAEASAKKHAEEFKF